MLDAILMPQWDLRYYSFNAGWTPGTMMASMRNGSGDEYFILFTEFGAALKGFAHESRMARFVVDHDRLWPGLLDSVPSDFKCLLEEPSFSMMETTFCAWWLNDDPGWKIGPIAFPPGPDPDGSEFLLSILDGDPKTYQAWAEEYYEVSVSLPLVQHVYGHQPLNEQVVRELNPETSLDELAAGIAEIGY